MDPKWIMILGNILKNQNIHVILLIKYCWITNVLLIWRMYCNKYSSLQSMWTALNAVKLRKFGIFIWAVTWWIFVIDNWYILCNHTLHEIALKLANIFLKNAIAGGGSSKTPHGFLGSWPKTMSVYTALHGEGGQKCPKINPHGLWIPHQSFRFFNLFLLS